MLEYSAMPAPRRWHFDMAHAQFGERIDVAWITAPAPWISGAGSVSRARRDELKIPLRHLVEERLMLALRQRPQNRCILIACVPVLAAANPNSARKSGTEAG